jgi:endonuclease YncB( thermonuclease family)
VTARTYGPYPAAVADWHDGDTAHLDVDLGFGLVLSLACRCYGINAPELSAPTGPAARNRGHGHQPRLGQVRRPVPGRDHPA